jgi:hypothetical protein
MDGAVAPEENMIDALENRQTTGDIFQSQEDPHV